MATEKLACSAVTSPDQWDLGAGADKVVAVNEPDDDYTTHISGANPNLIQRYSLEASAIPSGSTINSVSVSSRSMGGTNGRHRQGLALSTNTSESADIANLGFLSWATTVNVISRPGGGSWALTDLASLEAYLKVTNDANTCYTTTLFVSIDYTEGAVGPTGNMLLVF